MSIEVQNLETNKCGFFLQIIKITLKHQYQALVITPQDYNHLGQQAPSAPRDPVEAGLIQSKVSNRQLMLHPLQNQLKTYA